MRRLLILVCLPLCLLVLDGCRWGRKKAEPAKDYGRQLEAGQIALTEVSPAELPDLVLAGSERSDLVRALDFSLTFLARPSAQRYYPIAGISHADVVRSTQRMRELLQSGIDDAALNQAIRRDFRVYRSVGCDDQGTVLFTGYYTPIFNGSLTQDGRFRHPLYKRPSDLVTGKGDTVAQQTLANGDTRPYPARRDLEQSGVLHGTELVWLEDPFECYIIQVQGSGKIRLPSGEVIDVGYDGTNNHRYQPIADGLIADGKMRKEDLSLATLRAYFHAHPEEVTARTAVNPRFIFFTRTKGGPFGSIGQPVTTQVTIATDKTIFPPGGPTVVATDTFDRAGNRSPYAALRVDQDTGGAIRAPGRCDLYMGEGESAEHRAGNQYAEGRLYYLIAR